MKRICVVDDDPIAIYGLKKTLSAISKDIEVVSYSNGKQAFDSIAPTIQMQGHGIPDCILIDLNMPVMDGWQLIDRLTKLPGFKRLSTIKLFIVTSSISTEDKQRAASYDEVQGYITKPFKKEVIEPLFAESES
ncbi:MAG: response regulator [Flavobacteriales bacterium]|nr:response regulator [Flavobacteriales bacterium]